MPPGQTLPVQIACASSCSAAPSSRGIRTQMDPSHLHYGLGTAAYVPWRPLEHQILSSALVRSMVP